MKLSLKANSEDAKTTGIFPYQKQIDLYVDYNKSTRNTNQQNVMKKEVQGRGLQ